MILEKQLTSRSKEEIWQSYCGFLEYSMEEYMDIQFRLMEEQLGYLHDSEVGKSILQNKNPRTVAEFRQLVPLTTYDDYAELLLKKDSATLSIPPVVWIETTWEGGTHPVKVAPYNRSMLDTYRKNMICCFLLSSATEKNTFDIKMTDKLLYGLAPLPYATGLFPVLLKEEIALKFLPEPDDAVAMSFSERNKLGFQMAMKEDVEFFFGLGSVVYAVTKSIMDASKSNNKSFKGYSLKRLIKLIKAKQTAKSENRALMPKDLFHLKGFMVAGTDNTYYKDDLEEYWGIRPMEIFAGTEPTLLGTETWTRNGMYFFPDACFYEFIKEEDYKRLVIEPKFQPQTYLMNEVVVGEKYEIVVSVLKGGAFQRYRVKDVYECVGLTNKEDETKIPRFKYVDRTPDIIDIAGFTRLTEQTITKAIKHAKVDVTHWIARKEISNENRPYLKLYVEVSSEYMIQNPLTLTIIKELLTTYFNYLDQDYHDLKKILGMDPLEITLLPEHSFKQYQRLYGKYPTRINASNHEVIDLLECRERRGT